MIEAQRWLGSWIALAVVTAQLSKYRTANHSSSDNHGIKHQPFSKLKHLQ
jgi:hypothetical protein